MSKKRKSNKNPLERVRPPVELLRPLTPFEKRMAELSALAALSPENPDADAIRRLAASAAERDLSIRAKVREAAKRFPHWQRMRNLCGSGLLMASTLRDYLNDYVHRQHKVGFHGFPASFNVVESFLRFDKELVVFDLREEVEHLLCIDDYLDWYRATPAIRDPGVLIPVMREGVVYAYDMSGDASGYRLRTATSELVIAGVSLVRHGGELSCILVSGENPPATPDAEVNEDAKPVRTPRGKEVLQPDPDLTVADRYLAHLPGFARVILLARFDLTARRFDVRYLNLDRGQGYTVYTDDYSVVSYSFGEVDEKWRQQNETQLVRYEGLFSALTTLIFLPVAFVAEAEHVREHEVKTEYFHVQREKHIKEEVKEFGQRYCIYGRTVRALASAPKYHPAGEQRFEPPPFEAKSDGYWKQLPPGQLGQDKDGQPVAGRTWVTKTETWVEVKPQAFLMRRKASEPAGPDPGIVYVVRSPAHELELYKVGLTRKTAEGRAGELSSTTSAPLPFGILAQWAVGDCGYVEKEAHARLDAFRVSHRREFFKAPLSYIVRVVEGIVSEWEASRAT